MRILHLDLRAFGPFTNVAIDLSQGEEGLHVLYGPNEAGKSSALRAWSRCSSASRRDRPTTSSTPIRICGSGPRCPTAAPPLAFLRRKRRRTRLSARTTLPRWTIQRWRPSWAAWTAICSGPCSVSATRSWSKEARRSWAARATWASSCLLPGRVLPISRPFSPNWKTMPPNYSSPRIDAEDQSEPQGPRRGRKKIRQGQLPSEEWEFHQRSLGEARARRKEMDDRLLTLQTENNRLARIRQALPVIGRQRDAPAPRFVAGRPGPRAGLCRAAPQRSQRPGCCPH